MTESIYDCLILGGGPGGYTAALYCARSGLKTAVAEKMTAGGQMATTGQVDNYPGFEDGIDGFDLGQVMQRQAERFGAATLYGEVKAVDLRADPKVITVGKKTLLARTVVAATGAHARPLGVPEEDRYRGRGVAYCATCDGMMYRGKSVVVAGGGNSAVTDALYLSKLCKKVYLVHRRDTLRASKVYLDALNKAGVEFLWNSRITALHGERHLTSITVETIPTKDSFALACDGLFVAIGRQPETALFAGQLERDAQGYLIADETTKTNLPGVYAVGDVRTKPLRQIVTATADGAVASHFIEAYLSENGG